ncbi:hypothetical protein HYALB_00005462 [Hymenoscyphus albidus]|uniref:2EXR domain-containing protein n=1 Tax=Hymenoscyphus albidus TaxID=595503 RepID=A0A9N9LYW2_9HELO|nr:hypothetical protein HYALB_00005462 [Hymenoscyphus albidus]
MDSFVRFILRKLRAAEQHDHTRRVIETASQAPAALGEATIQSLPSDLSTSGGPKYHNTPQLQDFRRFLELPAELRQKIWRMATLVPQVVELIHDRSTEHGVIASPSGNCHLLAVNHESRTEAKSLLTYFENGDSDEYGPEPITAVNTALDTLCFTFPFGDRATTLLEALISSPEDPAFPLPKSRRHRSVAFSVDHWMRFTTHEYDNFGNLEDRKLSRVQMAFRYFGVEEVFLIISRRTSGNAKPVALKSPTMMPYEIMSRPGNDPFSRNLRDFITSRMVATNYQCGWNYLDASMTMAFKDVHM